MRLSNLSSNKEDRAPCLRQEDENENEYKKEYVGRICLKRVPFVVWRAIGKASQVSCHDEGQCLGWNLGGIRRTPTSCKKHTPGVEQLMIKARMLSFGFG